jgi:predicted nucleotide-binding protein (sugar kinase/HSP70/actin superfamily)
MKITFPYWGNYTIAFKALLEFLGLEVIPPEKTSSAAIQEGAKISPEMYCFPLKANIGNYLGAIRKGADTILMVTSLTGSCRLRYYGIIQDKALSEAGHKVKVVTFGQGLKDIYLVLREISGASLAKILRSLTFCFKELSLIEDLEIKAQYLRPRAKRKGETDEILRKAFLELEKINGLKGLVRFRNNIFKKLSEIEIEKGAMPPRVGLIGEIYTVTDGAINFDIEEKLGKEGLEVSRDMNITHHLKKGIFPWRDWQMQRKIRPYLQSTVGGHGRDAIYEMLNCIKNDFDGIVHLLPYGCMPEVTVRPILEKIHLQSGIPFLSLSLDEQVAEAGINTRIEAFVDVVKNYHQNKKI